MVLIPKKGFFVVFRFYEPLEGYIQKTWVRYNEGVTPLLDFLNLQTSLFSAQLQASESYKLRLESIVKLYLALGGGWEHEQYVESVE